jgi:DNA mismatch repair protein MutL
LVPYLLETTPFEAAAILENMDLFNRFGIKIYQTGPHVFSVDSIPQVFIDVDIVSLIKTIVKDLQENRDADSLKVEREKRLASAAMQASKTHSKKFSLEESQHFINRLMRCKMPFQCPLGKPTILFLSAEEISKKFQKE